MKTKNSILNPKRPWDFYSVLTKESFDIIKKSLIEDFANQDYVSRSWLRERLCQCVAYIELMEKQIKANEKAYDLETRWRHYDD